MRFFGKILGFILGLSSGTGLWGFLIGLLIGHIADNFSISQRKNYYFFNKNNKKIIFFKSIFQVMGYLSKSKGKVINEDIKIALLFMEHMQLYGKDKIEAKKAFCEGKKLNFPIQNTLKKLCNICFNRIDLIHNFLEIQIQVALSDGILHPQEKKVLLMIAKELKISDLQFQHILHIVKNNQTFNYFFSSSKNENIKKNFSLQDAYNILNVKKHDDILTIKRAYRKLMRKHHPDKLIAQKLSKNMMEKAKKKAQEIQLAYNLIKNEKK